MKSYPLTIYLQNISILCVDWRQETKKSKLQKIEEGKGINNTKHLSSTNWIVTSTDLLTTYEYVQHEVVEFSARMLSGIYLHIDKFFGSLQIYQLSGSFSMQYFDDISDLIHYHQFEERDGLAKVVECGISLPKHAKCEWLVHKLYYYENRHQQKIYLLLTSN